MVGEHWLRTDEPVAGQSERYDVSVHSIHRRNDREQRSVLAHRQGYGVFDGTVEWINQGVYFGKAGCAAQTDTWGDGCLNSEATVGTVGGITLDRAGNLYFSDTGYVISNTNPTTITYHSMIRRVDAVSKIVTVVAGNGTYGYAGDGGQATAAEVTAGEIAFDSKSNMYFTDGGYYLRRVDGSTGLISTVAGKGVYTAQQGYCAGGGGDAGAGGGGELC